MIAQLTLALGLSISLPLFAGNHQSIGNVAAATPHTPGPNCWNESLVAQGILSIRRFTHPHEFAYLIENLCQPLALPTLGALGRGYDQTGDVHAFIWINNERIYAKNSDSADEFPHVMPMKNMFKDYLVKRECLTAKTTSPGCLRKFQYYQCQKPQGKLAQQIKLLQPVDELMHELVYDPRTKFSNGDTCLGSSLQDRNEILQKIQRELEMISNLTQPDPQYLQYWLASLQHQIYQSKTSAEFYRCPKSERAHNLDTYKQLEGAIASFSELTKP